MKMALVLSDTVHCVLVSMRRLRELSVACEGARNRTSYLSTTIPGRDTWALRCGHVGSRTCPVDWP